MLATAHIWSMPFVYDDAEIATQSAAWSIGLAPFGVARVLGDGLPWAFHAVVLALHVVNGALLWLLARRWLSTVGACVALTLFWLHPLSLQAVFYVTGGREVWLTTVTLLALLGGLRGGVGGWALGLVALGAAAMVKLSALPVLIAVPLVWTADRGYARLLTIALLCVGLSTSGPWALSAEGLRTWGASLGRYLVFVAWPFGFSIVHDWSAVSAQVGGLAVVALLLCGLLAWDHSRAAWWAWLWVVVLTLPRAFVDGPPLTEAQTYLPFLACWGLLGWAADRTLFPRMTHG